MKILILALAFAAASCCAQTAHSVTLSWTPAAGAAAGTTYNIYRGAGACSGQPLVKVNATPVSGTSYVSTSVTAGATYCYAATAFDGTSESAYSNTVTAVVPADPAPPAPPTNLVATPK